METDPWSSNLIWKTVSDDNDEDDLCIDNGVEDIFEELSENCITEKEYVKYKEHQKNTKIKSPISNKLDNLNFLSNHLYNAFKNAGKKALTFTFEEDIKNNTAISLYMAIYKKDKNIFSLAIENKVSPFADVLDKENLFFLLSINDLDWVFEVCLKNENYKDKILKEILPFYIQKNNFEGIENIFNQGFDLSNDYQSSITYLTNINIGIVYNLYKKNKISLKDLEEKDKLDQNFFNYLGVAKNVEYIKEAVQLNLPLYNYPSILISGLLNNSKGVQNSILEYLKNNIKQITVQKLVMKITDASKFSDISHLNFFQEIRNKIYVGKNKLLLNAIKEAFLLNKSITIEKLEVKKELL